MMMARTKKGTFQHSQYTAGSCVELFNSYHARFMNNETHSLAIVVSSARPRDIQAVRGLSLSGDIAPFAAAHSLQQCPVRSGRR